MPSNAKLDPLTQAPDYRNAECCAWCAYGAHISRRGCMMCDLYGLVLMTSCCDDWEADVDDDGEADDD